jgi:ADP-heptose:LPS heptosyltransferase
LLHYNFIIATGPGEEKFFNEICKGLNFEIQHFKINDIQAYAGLISSAKLVVCSDSAAAHISVACNTKSICISNANHYGRFVPYPNTMNSLQTVILPSSFFLKSKEEQQQFYFGSQLNINEIDVNTVKKACIEALH